MFIKAPQTKEKLVRYTFSMPESGSDRLARYAAYVEDVSEAKADLKEILRLMVEGAMDADKGFSRWVKAAGLQAPAAAVPAEQPANEPVEDSDSKRRPAFPENF